MTSDLPANREEMLDIFAETARRASAKNQHATALAAQVKIAELMGYMQAPPPVTEEKIDPEAYRERICKVARRYGMVFPGETK